MIMSFRKTLILISAALTALVLLCTAESFADTNDFLTGTSDVQVSLNNQYTLIDGVKEGELSLSTGGKTAIAHVILIKANAKAKFVPVIPGYYTSGSTKTQRAEKAANWTDSSWSTAGLTTMVNQYESAADTTAGSVIAAVNGDFGAADTGKAPRGSVILEGNELKHSNVYEDEFYFGYKDDVINIVQRDMGQQDDFTDAVCGPMFILRNGEPFGVSDQTDSRERTGVAYKTNGDVLWITVTAADRKNDSSGISVKQLAELMKASGCWNGINMDGGGSTTMLTKRSGQSLSRKTADISSGYTQDSNGERLIQTGLMLVADNNAVANKVTTNFPLTNSINTDKNTYSAGSPINVTATTTYDGAWVSLLKASDSDSMTSYFWYYVYGCSDAGTWTWSNGATYDIFAEGVCSNREEVTSGWDLTPGQYKVLLLKGNYEKLAEKEITITEAVPPTEPYSLETDKEVYDISDSIYFKATAPILKTWVGLYLESDSYGSGVNSFFYYTLSPGDHNSWKVLNKAGGKVTEQQRADHGIGSKLKEGSYKVVLFKAYEGDNTYVVAETKHIRLVDKSKTYSITYKDGTSTLTGLTPATYKYADVENGALNLPSDVNKEGYIFKGWYENSDFSGSAVTSIPKGTTENKTFYAKFEQKTYEITFNTCGGSDVPSQTVGYGDQVVKPDDPTKQGEDFSYRFTGWVTEEGGSTPYDFNQPVTGSATIYASWIEPSDYYVTFDSRGGSTVLTQGIIAGHKVVKPEDPVWTGYTFDKWLSEDNTEFDFVNTIIDKNITLHATWTPVEYNIEFDENGGNSIADIKYTIETETFELPVTTREDYTFVEWQKEDGAPVDKIEKGSTGDLKIKAVWKKADSLKLDKTTYMEDEPINVTAYCEAPGSWVGIYKADDVPGATGTLAYYWDYITSQDEESVHCGDPFNILLYKSSDNTRPFEPGEYKAVLFGDGGYSTILTQVGFTLTENTNPTRGTLTLTGESRGDKKYSGSASSQKGIKLAEFFYGDAINVKAELSGAMTAGAWVGVVSDEDYSNNNVSNVIGGNWFYVDDFPGETVNLNYVNESSIAADAERIKFGLNYWAVLVSGSGRILDAQPFNFRTYNMDWLSSKITDEDRQKIQSNIKVDQEWTTKVITGENLRPAIKITRVNGHFGYTRDNNGNMKEITEEELVQGVDYDITYPTESREVGVYTVTVEFPDSQPSQDSDKYRYLDADSDPENYAFKDGFKYYLISSENDHLIDYVLNGGVNDDRNPTFYQTGTETKLYAPTRTGFIFDGWYTTDDFQEGTEIEKIPADAKENITVYAKWISEEEIAYKITYVLNGGENDVSNPIGYTGKVDISIKPATKPGYTFAGWFFDAEFTLPADTIAKGMTGDLTLYAKFIKNERTSFRITTDVINGSISENTNVKKGESHTVTYEPNEGMVLKQIIVDGNDVDIKSHENAYTFKDVSADHSITVIFGEPGDSVTDGYAFAYGGSRYKVVSAKKGTATLVKAKNSKKVTVPAKAKLNGKVYKVVKINAKAFTGKKIRTVVIGKNVSKIAKNSFSKSKATKVIVKTKKLKKKSVKGCFKKSKVKTVQVKVGKKKVNKTYVKKYKKIFTKKNAGKKVKVK